MRAAVYHGRGDVRIEDVPTPAPAPGELLLRIAAAGICGTDANEFATGPHMFPIERADPRSGHEGPMIPGHEFVGRIEGAGDGVGDFADGMLVVSGAGVSCGRCDWCRRGRTNLCERYWTVGLQGNGALAEYAAVPASSCVDASDLGLSADALALAQPMSIAVHAMRRGRLEPGDVAVVIGAGGIGAFLSYVTAALGATVVAVDLDPKRLDMAARLGATHVVDAADGPLSERLARDGLVPIVAYEVTGTAAGLDSALGLLSWGTRLVLIGHQAAGRELDLPALTLGEHEVIGTNAHVLRADLPEALRLLAARPEGWSDVAPTVVPLDGLVGELRALADGSSGRIKTLIDPWATGARATRM